MYANFLKYWFEEINVLGTKALFKYTTDLN